MRTTSDTTTTVEQPTSTTRYLVVGTTMSGGLAALHRWQHSSGADLGHARRTTTPCAWSASARRSWRSPVSTAPNGSASATTMASTAEPRPARARSAAARRAMGSGSSLIRSQVLRKRLTFASRSDRPEVASTSTTVGTSGGHHRSRCRTLIKAAVSGRRRESRLTPPESSTSTDQPVSAAGRCAASRRAIDSAFAISASEGSPTSSMSSAT